MKIHSHIACCNIFSSIHKMLRSNQTSYMYQKESKYVNIYAQFPDTMYSNWYLNEGFL